MKSDSTHSSVSSPQQHSKHIVLCCEDDDHRDLADGEISGSERVGEKVGLVETAVGHQGKVRDED